MPWPPPEASAIAEIEAGFFARDQTLWDAATRLRRMLARHGYEDQGWYLTPNGFVVATRCERIDDRGTVLQDPRFSVDIPLFDNFSVRGILRAMFWAPEGRFRVILIAVTSDPAAIRRRTTESDASDVEALSPDGSAVIPGKLRNFRLASHTGLILFYEIVKTGEGTPWIIGNGLTSAEHIRGSGLEIR